MDKKPLILAIGANPAWQKVLQFKKLSFAEVNRAEFLWSFASGKGINFARAARYWNAAEVELVQFAGGDNGKLILDDLQQEKLNVKSFQSIHPTRCCITCLSDHDNSMTELIEPSQPPTEEIQQQALDYIKDRMKFADGMALCGQLPSGMDIDFYVKCAQMAAAENKPLLIDSWKNIAPVLKVAGNAILKINADELQALTNISDMQSALKMLFASYNLRGVAITNGAKDACFAVPGKCWSYTIPRLDHVVNPVGSGDTNAAVFLSELVAGNAPEIAFGYALAAATANCCSMKCGEFEKSAAADFYKSVNMTLM